MPKKKKTAKKPSGSKPAFAHSCVRCAFLGTLEHPSLAAGKHEHFDDPPSPCDLYVCSQNGIMPTVIARYSSVPSEYSSGLRFAKDRTIPELAEAFRRAVELGILTSDGEVSGESGVQAIPDRHV